MKKKITKSILTIATFLPFLSGCNNTSNRWNYTRNDISNFKELEGEDITTEGKRIISYSGNEYLFEDELNLNDVKVYNYTKIVNDLAEGKISTKEGYIPYKTMCKYTADVESIENSYASFKVTFEGEDDNQYRVLLNKDTNVDNVFIDVEGRRNDVGEHSDIEIDLEEKYIEADTSWATTKSLINIAGGIIQIVVGTMSSCPTAQAGGIFTIITSVGDLFGYQGDPTIGDVMNKLSEMDKKLDDIQAQINKNHQELIDLNLLIELGISQEMMLQYENGISQFKADYAKPIDLLLKKFRYYTEDCFKNLVKQEKFVDLYFLKENGKWTLQTITDTDHVNKEHISFMINSWPNSQAYLANNDDVVGQGFMDEVQKDINLAIDNVNTLQGMSKNDLSTNALYALTEEFGYQRYKDDKDSAIELASLAEQFAEEISTGNVVRYYMERLKMIYNFNAEGKGRLMEAYAGLDRQLDIFCGQAAEALRFSKQNTTSLATAWANARNYIAEYYASIKDVDDNYCYTTNCYLSADFYRVKYDLSYSNPGDDCRFNASINFARVDRWFDEVKYTKMGINDLDVLEEINYKRIVNKFNLLKRSGYYGMSVAFVSYLRGATVLPLDAAYNFDYLLHKGTITVENEKFATVITQRKLTDSDKDFQLTCVAVGNPDSEYFNIGWKGKYKSKHEADCWSGYMLQTTFFSGETGDVIPNDTRVCAYARYDEAHTFWIDDEHWAFTDYVNGNYFYMISRVTPQD